MIYKPKDTSYRQLIKRLQGDTAVREYDASLKRMKRFNAKIGGLLNDVEREAFLQVLRENETGQPTLVERARQNALRTNREKSVRALISSETQEFLTKRADKKHGSIYTADLSPKLTAKDFGNLRTELTFEQKLEVEKALEFLRSEHMKGNTVTYTYEQMKTDFDNGNLDISTFNGLMRIAKKDNYFLSGGGSD